MSSTPPPAIPNAFSDPSPDHHVPPKAGTFGMVLFLASLVMLFGSLMLGYVLIRIQQTRDIINPATKEVLPANAPPLGSLHLPWGLWLSTFIILASSAAMHRALKNIQRERQGPFRKNLVLTLVLSGLFLLVQAPSLGGLMYDHFQADTGHALLGLIFFLILTHALHVIGGIIPLAVVTRNAHQGHYDHESHGPVKYLAMYWHFLDIVWMVMFGVLLFTR
ncbi:MAG: cytochrome c oxidase subunit 3 [Algisphaera sp.]